MSEAWVYRHADELGVERRGSGPKARLRFDLERARAAFVTCEHEPDPSSDYTHTPAPRAPLGGAVAGPRGALESLYVK